MVRSAGTGRRLIGILACLAPIVFCHSAAAGELGVSASGRHLVRDGEPFFWLGDTVWLLTQLPSDEELELYLDTRAKQGFTVVQLTAVMGEERVWGTLRATSRGDLPFLNGDVSRPAVTSGDDRADAEQYDYWDHLDYVLERIRARGMQPALVTYFVGWRGDGYTYLTPEKAHGYGKFLGERYRDDPELIWILGGDNTPDTAEKKAVWNAVAKGVAEGLTGSEDYSRVLMTYHINGGASSSQHWHDAPWLDFNMAQTWSSYRDIYPAVRRDYEMMPPKPCGLGEGAYEDGPQYPTKPIDALVIRQQACWSYFAGGYHTYGNGNVWHFDTVKNESTEPWKEALRSEGAESLIHAKTFLESVEWSRCVPDASLIAEGRGKRERPNVALRRIDNSAVAVYLAAPQAVKLQLERLDVQARLQATWTDPATGEQTAAESFDDRSRRFEPPRGWMDAFLVVRGASE